MEIAVRIMKPEIGQELVGLTKKLAIAQADGEFPEQQMRARLFGGNMADQFKSHIARRGKFSRLASPRA